MKNENLNAYGKTCQSIENLLFEQERISPWKKYMYVFLPFFLVHGWKIVWFVAFFGGWYIIVCMEMYFLIENQRELIWESGVGGLKALEDVNNT